MYKNHDDLAAQLPLHAASQADERDDIPTQHDYDGNESVNGNEESLPDHITIVPFSTTKTGSFQ